MRINAARAVMTEAVVRTGGLQKKLEDAIEVEDYVAFAIVESRRTVAGPHRGRDPSAG